MAGTEQIRVMRVEGRVTGMQLVTTSLGKAAVATADLTKSSDALTISQDKVTARFAMMSRAIEMQNRQAATYAQLNDRLSDSVAAMNDTAAASSRSFGLSNIEIASTANHMKQATLAAYALSPAFRNMVNPAITASFRALGPAAVSAGGAALSALSPVLAMASRIALPIGLAVESFRAMNAITQLGTERMEEFFDLATKAGGSGVSTDFFQRHAKSADDFSLKADVATAALKSFNEASQPKLGGSVFDSRLQELTKAGNFLDNAGVAALKQANTIEERYRAVGELIATAADQGQRLAALDLAAKFLPPEMMERLRTNGGLLKEMQATADAIKPADLISAEQVAYALQLRTRLDAANDTIANKFKPLQQDLTDLGLNLKENWISTVELMAGAVSKANDLYSALKGIPGLFAQAGSAPFWNRLTQYTESLGLNSTPESMGIKPVNGPDSQREAANAKLGSLLQNPNVVQQGMQSATNVQTAVLGDLSKVPSNPAANNSAMDSVDRAINTLRKHTEEQLADVRAMDLGTGALTKFRAEAALTAAIQANGGEITAEQAKQFATLKDRAEAAAVSLERAKVSSSISFGRSTALLLPEDVQIAQQLKGLYPDVADALASTEAAAMRANNAFRSMGALGQDVNRGLFVDFQTGIRNGVGAWDSFKQAGVGALGKIADKLTSMAADNLWASAFGGSSAGGFGGLLGSFFGGSNPSVPGAVGVVGAAGAGVSVPTFAGGINYAPGGMSIIGEGGRGEIVDLPTGARVIPHDVSMEMARANDNGGSFTLHMGDSTVIVQGNADEKALAAIQREFAKRDAELEPRVRQIVQRRGQKGW